MYSRKSRILQMTYLYVYSVVWRKTEQRRVYMRGVWNIVSPPRGTWLPSVHWLSSARKSLEMAQTPPAKQNPWKFFKSSLSETDKICKLGFLRFFLCSLLSVGAQNEKWKQKIFLGYNCIERISVISNQFTKKSSTINKFRSCPMAWLYNFLSDYLEAMLFEFAG